MNSSERSLLVFVLIDRRDHLEDSLKTIYSKTASVFFVFLVTVDDKNLSDVIRVIFEEDNYCILYIHKEEIKERILFFALQNDYEFAMFLRGGDVIANKNFLDNTIYFFKEYKANCSLFQGGVIKGKYVKDTSLLIFTKSSKFFDKKTFYEEVFFEKEFQLPELFDGFTFNISFLLQFLNREEVNENLIFNLFKTEELYILFAPVLYRRYSQEHVASNIRKLGTFLKQQIDLSQVMRLGFCQLLKDTLKSASTNDYSKLGKIVKEASAKTLLSQESRKKRLFLNLLNFPLFYPLLTYYIGLRKKGNIEVVAESQRISYIEPSVLKYHEAAFSKFRGINKGKKIGLIATGPSLSRYISIPNIKYLGVNKIIRHSDFELDYYFIQDISGATEYIEDIANPKNAHIQKFFGRIRDYVKIPQNTVPAFFEDLPNSHIYFTSYPVHRFEELIDCFPLPDFGSVAFSALSFLLWTHPDTIYLIGCDCTSGYYDGKPSTNFIKLKKGWVQAKLFLDCFIQMLKLSQLIQRGLKDFLQMNTKETIKVFFSIDNNYVEQCVVTIASILKHSSSYIEFIILDFGIKEKEKNILRASVSSSDCSTLTFINVKDRFIDFKEVRYLTRAMYGRFLIPQLFPSEEKVIYSDVDVVFKSDIRDLFETDLQGKILGACPEIFDDNNGCNQKKKERLELGFAHEYFSSGLLLINSRLWNESGIQKRIEEAYRQKKEVLICPDQDLLNVVFCNNYKKINNKWCVVNQLIESYTSPYFFFFSKLDGVGIRHFNGKNKPWKRSPSLFEKAVEVGTLEYWRYLLSSDLLKENLFYSKLSFSKKMQLNIVLRLSYLFC